MGQSHPFSRNVDLVISYQTHDYNLGGLIVKKGYFVSRNGMRITRSFKTAQELVELFPDSSISDGALRQMVKDAPKQLDLFLLGDPRSAIRRG